MSAKARKSHLKVLGRSLTLPCGLVLQNRIAKAAMTEHLADASGRPNKKHFCLYRRWARGGAGLVMTGNASVDARWLEGPGNVVVEEQKCLPALRRWAAVVDQTGSRLLMQVVHPGALSTSPDPVSPSGVWVARDRFARPRELRAGEIQEVVRRFAKSVELARRAGFAGVQIHAAHGFLISQFLSSRTNLRSDKWGGPLERRMRLLLEIVSAARAALGEQLALGVKLNAADYVAGGFSEDESLEVIEVLDRLGVDFVEISGGSYEQAAMWGTLVCRKDRGRTPVEGFFTAFARRARQSLSRAALMVTGGFRTAEGMARAVQEYGIDLIGVARPMIFEPDLPYKILSGKVAAACDRPPIGKNVFEQLSWFQRELRMRAQRGASVS